MRYIIDTKDEEGIIGMQISKWKKDNKLDLIEKGEPVIEIKIQLEKVAKALQISKKSGYNSEVMKCFIHDKTKVAKSSINSILSSQEEFFKQIGVIDKKK